jgi:predicted DNA-binding transcriptional regulator AlpA
VCKLLAEVRDLIAAPTRPAAELLNRDDMAAVLNVGVSTFDRLKAAGKIGPRPLELAGVKYAAAEVRVWLAHRDPAGELYDATSWPAVWAGLQPPAGKSR